MKLKYLISSYIILILLLSIMVSKRFYGEDNYGQYDKQMKVRDKNLIRGIQFPAMPAGIAVSSNEEDVYAVIPLRPQILRFNLKQNKITLQQYLGDYFLAGIALSKDNQYIYIARPYADKITIISANTFDEIASVKVGDYPIKIVPDNEGKYLYTINYFGGSISVIDLRQNRTVKDIPVGRYPSDLAISKNSQYAYVVNSGDGSVSIIDLWQRQILKTRDLKVSVDGIAFDEVHHRIYVSAPRENKVLVLSLPDIALENQLSMGRYPTKLGISEDGKILSVLNSIGNTLTFVDLENKASVKEIFVGRCPIEIHALKQSGKICIANSFDWLNCIAIVNDLGTVTQ